MGPWHIRGCYALEKKWIHNKGHFILWYGNINSGQNSILAVSCTMNPSVVDWIRGSPERNCWLAVWTLIPNVAISVNVLFDTSLVCRSVWCRLKVNEFWVWGICGGIPTKEKYLSQCHFAHHRPDVTIIIKLRRMRWVGYIADMKRQEICIRYRSENLKCCRWMWEYNIKIYLK